MEIEEGVIRRSRRPAFVKSISEMRRVDGIKKCKVIIRKVDADYSL